MSNLSKIDRMRASARSAEDDDWQQGLRGDLQEAMREVSLASPPAAGDDDAFVVDNPDIANEERAAGPVFQLPPRPSARPRRSTSKAATVAGDADDDVTMTDAQGIFAESSTPASRSSSTRRQSSSSMASVQSVSSSKSADDTPSRASGTYTVEKFGVERLEWRKPDGLYDSISNILDDHALEILTAWWDMYQTKEAFHKSWVKLDPETAAKNCCATRCYSQVSKFPNAGYQCELCSQLNRSCIVMQYDGQESREERPSHTVVLPQFGKAADAPFAYWQSKVV